VGGICFGHRQSGGIVMKMHEYKTTNPFFDDLWNGRKPPVEIRKDDRPDKVEIGDMFWLREFDPTCQMGGDYIGRAIVAKVTYILPPFAGIAKGYKLYGIYILDKQEKQYDIQ
jgi:hypothetical protein